MAWRGESDEQERKLFVGGLSRNTDEDLVKNYFETYGNIIDCTVMRDQERNSRGFGFVLFEDSSSVDKIIAAKKDGTTFNLDEQNIEIKRAFPKSGGGGSYGGSRGERTNYRKIFVGGLPSTASEEKIRDYFESYGKVNEVELVRDHESNRLRGFAFVTFEDGDCADKCIQRRTHEICNKICEVKRAETKSRAPKREEGQFNNRGRESQQSGGASGGSLSMTEVNQLIQQAFAMGQQSCQAGMQAPTAASLLNGGAAASGASNLLQTLLGQHAAPAPAPPPAPAPAPAPNAAVTQLAQLLQSGGIDTNALVSLLSQQQETPASTGTAGKTNGNYSNYPPYNYSNTSASNYGPSKDEDSKHSYRPY